MKGVRRREKRFLLLAGASGVVITALALGIFKSQQGETESFTNNILVIGMLFLTVIALLVMIFMVGRNAVKLVFERRRGILGSRLRARLVVAFGLVAFVPMTLSFLFASGLINKALEGWITEQIEGTVTSSLDIARRNLQGTKVDVERASNLIAQELVDLDRGFEVTPELLSRLARIRTMYDLYAVRIVSPTGDIIVESSHAASQVDSFREPAVRREAVKAARSGGCIVRIEERGASQFVRAYTPIRAGILVVSHRMDPDIVRAQRVIDDSFRDYEQIKLYKNPLRSQFFLLLALFNLVAIFGAIWVAFFVAKQITGPIQRLAEGMGRVGRGRYDFTVEPGRDDEVGFLVNSFNQMLRELRESHSEADRRGVLIETIISNLAVGVIALDGEMRVTTVNSAAASMFQIDHVHLPSGKLLSELLRPEDYQQCAGLLENIGGSSQRGDGVAEVEMRLLSGGRELLIVATGGRIINASGVALGYVLIFDDVSELSKAQHLAAWRDVARRIAHEIKNPLTPIQLSAQRLERLLLNSPHVEAVGESTRTIVEHVAILKRLANEFSEYGRMPQAVFSSTDVGTLVRHTVENFRAEYPGVRISCDVHGKIPEILLDPEQIRGVMSNLLRNGVEALVGMAHEDGKPRRERGPEIDVISSFDKRRERFILEIKDNGPGIKAADKNRIFEPYFTTKKGGTGLGLAIVSSIISDHQGEIRVFDNHPHGTRFVVQLPRHPQVATLRKLDRGG